MLITFYDNNVDHVISCSVNIIQKLLSGHSDVLCNCNSEKLLTLVDRTSSSLHMHEFSSHDHVSMYDVVLAVTINLLSLKP